MATVMDAASAGLKVSQDKDLEPEHLEDSDDNFTWTPEEEKKLVRKIDLYLLPTIWIMYLLSYMDRTKSVIPHVRFTFN